MSSFRFSACFQWYLDFGWYFQYLWQHIDVSESAMVNDKRVGADAMFSMCFYRNNVWMAFCVNLEF